MTDISNRIKDLYRLKENGKKIFVITAAHDYNDSAYILQGEGRVQKSFSKVYQSIVELFTGKQVTYPHQ